MASKDDGDQADEEAAEGRRDEPQQRDRPVDSPSHWPAAQDQSRRARAKNADLGGPRVSTAARHVAQCGGLEQAHGCRGRVSEQGRLVMRREQASGLHRHPASGS